MASITSAQSGLASATTTWVGGVVPVVGDKVTIAAGHVVILNGTYVWGDDTTTAININGTLAASRLLSCKLTVRGQLVLGAGGVLDFGTETNPVPSGITAELEYNDSAAMASNKYGLTVVANAGGFRAWGATKTYYSTISAFTSQTVFDVLDGAGWAAGDVLFFAPNTIGVTNTEVRAIQSVTALGGTAVRVTLTAALSNSNFIGRVVGNVTRNVRIYGKDPANFPCNFSIATNAMVDSGSEVGYVEFIGSSPANAQQSFVNIGGNRLKLRDVVGCSFHDVVAIAGSTLTLAAVGSGTSQCMASLNTANRPARNMLVCSKRGNRGIGGGNNAYVNVERPVVIGCEIPLAQMNNTGSASFLRCVDAITRGSSFLVGGNYLGGAEIVGGDFDAYGTLMSAVLAMVGDVFYFRNSRLAQGLGTTNTTPFVQTTATIANSRFVLDNCLVPAAYAVTRYANLGQASGITDITIKSKSGDPSAQFRWTSGGEQARDNAIYDHGLSSVRMDAWFTGIQNTYSFTVPVGANQTIKLLGAMRYNAIYGTAFPPTVTVSGLGITPAVATCPTTAADTWHDYSLTVTNPNAYPGEFTVTYTVQSNANSAGAYCWFDGVTNSPWVDLVRHFGYLFDQNAYQTADPRITLTETEALALPVAVNHVAQTITVTGALTNTQVFQACMADLCQTANLSRAVHIDSDDGADFTTSYTVVIGAGGSIAGSYTHAGGRVTTIQVPNMISGSRVQLLDVASNTQLFNDVVTGALSVPATWTADRTIRMRAEHATKLPIEVTGLFTVAGLTFLQMQDDDTVYNGNGIDGSTCTEFIADGANIQVDVNDPDGVTSVQRLYAWMQWYQTTYEGIASSFFGAMVAIDEVNYRIDQSMADIKLDNVATAPVMFVGGYLSRVDGSTVIAATSGSIQMDPGKAYVAPGLSVPSPTQIATAVRSELTPELQRVDTSISSRMPTSAYVAPANDTVTDIARIHGLVADAPLVVTASTRTAGDITQSVSEEDGVVTVTRLS